MYYRKNIVLRVQETGYYKLAKYSKEKTRMVLVLRT